MRVGELRTEVIESIDRAARTLHSEVASEIKQLRVGIESAASPSPDTLQFLRDEISALKSEVIELRREMQPRQEPAAASMVANVPETETAEPDEVPTPATE